METIDISKAVRRRTDRRRHLMRRVSGEGNSALDRIAHLQRILDSKIKKGDMDGFAAGRRELYDLILAVVSKDVMSGERI